MMTPAPENHPTSLIPRFLCSICIWALLTSLILTIRGDFPALRSKLKNIPGIAGLIRERDQVVASAKIETLNYAIPVFDFLVHRLENRLPSDPAELSRYNPYIDYYEKVVALYPQLSEAYGLLGFLYAEQGQTEKGISFYKIAINLNPKFFWFSHNLGILYFKNHQYREAALAFKLALTSDPVLTIQTITRSTVYRQILAQKNEFLSRVPENLRQAYAESYILLTASERMAQQPLSQFDGALTQKLILQIL